MANTGGVLSGRWSGLECEGAVEHRGCFIGQVGCFWSVTGEAKHAFCCCCVPGAAGRGPAGVKAAGSAGPPPPADPERAE